MTDARLRAVLDDLAAEGDWLEGLVSPLDETGWRTPTPAEGWDVATTIAHLAWTDEVAVLAATDKDAWDAIVLQAIDDPMGFVDAAAAKGATETADSLVERWRTSRPRLAEVLLAHPPGEKLPWFGPPMSPTSMGTARYMETWAHGLDVAEALGVQVEPHDRVRHVVHLGARTLAFSFVSNGLEPPPATVRVSVTAPSGALWEHGPADTDQQVTGSAWDFALLVTQRRHRSDLDLYAEGDVADQWLDIAQAFAGPSGGGRAPGVAP